MINSGYNRKCKDSIAGISKLWMFPYVKYSRSQILTNSNVLTGFPATTIYEYYCLENPNFTEKQEMDDGGKYYSQDISITLSQTNNDYDLIKLLNKDYRIIIQDRNGLYRILGLYNGLEANKIEYQTGNSKPELNGYRIDFTGKEEKGSFFLNNLNDFNIFGNINSRITQNLSYRITQNSELRLVQ